MVALFDVDAIGAAYSPYAPGALACNPSRDENDCPGCLAHPLHECAACGAPASVALPAGVHAMSLCAGCYGVVLDIRASAQEHRERMAPNTAAMIAGRQKLREEQRERQKQRQEQHPATPPVAPARADLCADASPDLAPSMPTPAPAQPIQARLFDLDAMLQEATRQIVQDITRRVFQPMADAMGLALTGEGSEGASTTPGADLLAQSGHQTAHQKQPTRQEALQARQEARVRERQERRETRERERQEQRQTRAQARQEARQSAKGRNAQHTHTGTLSARRTRQEAQEGQRGLVSDSLARTNARQVPAGPGTRPGAPGGARLPQTHSKPRNTFNAYRGRQTHQGRTDRREEREELASMARRSGEEGAA